MNFVMLTFDKDHTHAGQPIKRGEKREIPTYNAEWLIAHGVAHVTPSSSSPSPTPRDRSPRRTDTREDSDHAQ